MTSTGATHAARGGRNGKASRVGEPKNKIKKLTADKIREHLPQISRKNGEIDLTGHGIETIISLDGLQHTTKLMLSHNKLTKLSDMKRVQNITMLKLIDNKLNGEVCVCFVYITRVCLRLNSGVVVHGTLVFDT